MGDERGVVGPLLVLVVLLSRPLGLGAALLAQLELVSLNTALLAVSHVGTQGLLVFK